MDEGSILGGNFFLSLNKGQSFSNNILKTNSFFNLNSLNLLTDSNNRMMSDLNTKANSNQQEGISKFIQRVQEILLVFDEWLSDTALKELKKSQRFFVRGHIKSVTILPELLLKMHQVKQSNGGITDYVKAITELGLLAVVAEIIGRIVKSWLKKLFFIPFLKNPIALAATTVLLTTLAAKGVYGLLKKLSTQEIKENIADKYNSAYESGSRLSQFPYGWKLWNYQFPNKYAIGLPRVPYDNFPALLHEGESVLTKRETNNLHNSLGGVNIAKLSDTIIVREEADIDRIATALASRIRQAALNMA